MEPVRGWQGIETDITGHPGWNAYSSLFDEPMMSTMFVPASDLCLSQALAASSPSGLSRAARRRNRRTRCADRHTTSLSRNQLLLLRRPDPGTRSQPREQCSTKYIVIEVSAPCQACLKATYMLSAVTDASDTFYPEAEAQPASSVACDNCVPEADSQPGSSDVHYIQTSEDNAQTASYDACEKCVPEFDPQPAPSEASSQLACPKIGDENASGQQDASASGCDATDVCTPADDEILSTACDNISISIGDIVELVGLKTDALNGRIGRVEAFFAASTRFAVHLLKHNLPDLSSDRKLLKSVNLQWHEPR